MLVVCIKQHHVKAITELKHEVGDFPSRADCLLTIKMVLVACGVLSGV